MTKQFRVYVRKADGSYGVEQRRVVNFPDVRPDKVTEYVTKLWAKQYPGEEYDEIQDMAELRPAPHPGMFPADMSVPQ